MAPATPDPGAQRPCRSTPSWLALKIEPIPTHYVEADVAALLHTAGLGACYQEFFVAVRPDGASSGHFLLLFSGYAALRAAQRQLSRLELSPLGVALRSCPVLLSFSCF